MIRISTFNIQNDFKKYNKAKTEEIYNYLENNKIDILGLQEVYSKINKDLCTCLKGNYNYIGKYRFFLKKIFNIINEKNPIITKYEIIENKTYHLPHYPSLLKRIITRATIKYNDKTISIYNTHLDYKYNSVKKRQLKKIYKIISKDNNPKILLGDFNLKNNKTIFNNFEDKLKELNMYRVELNEKTFKASKYKREIDHIFLSKDFVLKDKKVIRNISTSDHYPILVDVEI